MPTVEKSARRNSGGRRLLRTAAAVAALSLGLAPVAAAHAASGPATITGTVVAGTKPLVNAPVELVAIGSSGTKVTKATTDAAGKFGFTGLTPGNDVAYTVEAIYKDTRFASDSMTLQAGATQDVTVKVYPTTVSPAAVKLAAWTVWVDFETDNKMAVQQDLALDNKGSAAFVGSTPVTVATGTSTAAVLLPIAPGAGSFEYLGRFQSCCWASNSSTWAHVRPITPGTSTGTMRYVSPRTATLSFPAQFPVDSFTLLVPAGTSVTSTQLKAAGTEVDGSTKYSIYRGGPLATGAVVTFTVGAPPKSMAPLYSAIAIIVVLVGGLIAWLLWRRRSRQQPVRPSGNSSRTSSAESQRSAEPELVAVSTGKPKAGNGSSPAAGSKPASKPAPRKAGDAAPKPKGTKARADGATTTSTDPKELADELARLDLAFENGSLDDEHTYHIIREALVQRLVSAVAGDPEALG